MEQTKKEDGVYFGLDISNRYTLISYYQLHMEEPATISTVMGTEAYQIPTLLAKRKGMGQWFFGNEARRRIQSNEAEAVEDLYENALSGKRVFVDGEDYDSRELFMIFIRKILSMPGTYQAGSHLAKLVVTVGELNLTVVELFNMVANRMGLSSQQLVVIDYRESFYYYVLNQEPSIFLHDVMMFDFTGKNLLHCRLKRDMYQKPQVVTLEQGNHGSLIENRDMAFDRVITETFGEDYISAVYLIGDGFDDDWMKVSLQHLCQGRRVFLGKNLYSKGACYAGAIKDGCRDWPFIYIGDNELKLNVSLKVSDQNELKFVNLVNAGDNWYESHGECEVILEGSPEIEVWVQRLDNRQSRVEVLELSDLPKRESRMTRLRISAKASNDKQVVIEIKDLGFGELVPATNKTWSHTVSIA
ncbi:MAG: hypothetical protein K6G04_03605 [Lachnospiraceae bacterium]|nr:hypothetical protein [Lachnospiraceae bacterium]